MRRIYRKTVNTRQKSLEDRVDSLERRHYTMPMCCEMPVAYCAGSNFTIGDGEFWGLGMLVGTDPDEFGAADSIIIQNAVSDGSDGEDSSLILYDNAGEGGIQLFGEQFIHIHGGLLLSGPLDAGETLTVFVSNMYADQWNEAMTTGFAFPNISFNALFPYHGPLYDPLTTGIWPNNNFDVVASASGGDVAVVQTVMNVAVLSHLGDIIANV